MNTSRSSYDHAETGSGPELTADLNWHDGVAILEVSGDVDMVTAPKFQEALSAALEERPTKLVVDLIGVNFFASAGLSVLVAAYKQTNEVSNGLRVVATNSATLRPLQVTALDRKIPVFGSREEALAGD